MDRRKRRGLLMNLKTEELLFKVGSVVLGLLLIAVLMIGIFVVTLGLLHLAVVLLSI